MKKVIFGIIAILAVFGTSNVLAQESKNQFEIILETGKVDYVGKFTKIYMNGPKTLPTGEYAAIITDNGPTFDLELTVPKIGAMPANIYVNASDINIDAEGNFDQVVDGAISLLIWDFDARIHGKLDKETNTLLLDIESVDASFLGQSFDAQISFIGNRK